MQIKMLYFSQTCLVLLHLFACWWENWKIMLRIWKFKTTNYGDTYFADEKEEQFQIGLPTDVKHVAHIGSDDPSANAPSWVLFSFSTLTVFV